MRIFLAAVLAAALALSSAHAQPPSADWRTIETPRFRIHHPVEATAWAQHVAARIEAIRDRVIAVVGHEPTQIVDVMIMDPAATANGSAWPFTGAPRMVLWTTPPASDAVIGHYGDWPTLLIAHEDVHLVHMLRERRGDGLGAQLDRLLPAGPITRRVPRWLIEGYATRLEGALTGWGRPNGDLRAAILRRWAQHGRLPRYDRVSSIGGPWRNGSMAYLAGSAFVEWLMMRAGGGAAGEDAERALWARLTAVEARSFDDAFAGVYGAPPRALYDRFRAELTYVALDLERQRRAEMPDPIGADDGGGDILWQDLSWTTGRPALTPDGARLAIVLRAQNAPPRLVVWSTEDRTAADAQARREAIERLRARDPEDVPAVRRGPRARTPLHVLPGRDGTSPHDPRWLPDGAALLFMRREP
ncbi:MAG: hypothetical protein AAF772_14970, partial [Acidobacteriota bacterium]